MKRIAVSAAVAATLASAVLAADAVARPAMAHPKLIGSVGKNDAFVITLKKPNGNLVKTLPAGTYTFVVHDYSSLHNFQLSGPHGFSKVITTVSGIMTKTVTLKLTPGRYKYFCVIHVSSGMLHFFTVK